MPGADDDMREPPAKRQAVGATPEAAPVAETPGESGRGTRRRAREQPVATSEKQHGGEQNSPSNVGAGPADVAAASGGPGANAAAGSAAGAATGASAGATGAVPGAAPGMQRAEAASAPAEAPAAAKRAAAAASARDPASAGGTAPEAPGPAAGGASDAAAGDGTPRVGENAGGAAGGVPGGVLRQQPHARPRDVMGPHVGFGHRKRRERLQVVRLLEPSPLRQGRRARLCLPGRQRGVPRRRRPADSRLESAPEEAQEDCVQLVQPAGPARVGARTREGQQ